MWRFWMALDINRDGKDIDQASLISFCSGTDCFVTTAYDQTGNARHATQTTPGRQPKIYDSVSGIILDTGLPSIEFAEANLHHLDMASISTDTLHSYYLTNYASDLKAIWPTMNDGGTIPYGYVAESGNTSTVITSGYGTPSLYVNNALQSPVNRGDVYTATSGRNIILHYCDTSAATGWGFGDYAGGSIRSYSGNLYGILHFFSDQSATQSATHDALNNYFSIY